MTGQLGTSQSELGQFELGNAGQILVSFSDSMTLSDTFSGINQDTGSASDTMTFTDSFTWNSVLHLPFSDTMTFTDAMAPGLVNFTGQLGTIRSALANIILGYGFSLNSGLSDHFTFSDTFTENSVLNKTLSDTVTFADLFTHADTSNETLSDTLTFTDVFPALMADHLTLTDSMTPQLSLIGLMSDTMTLTGTLTENHNSSQMYGDNMIVFDRLTFNQVKRLSWSDTVTFSDSIQGYLVEQLTDTFTLSDSFTEFKAHNLVPDILGLGDFFNIRQITFWSIADGLTLFESNPPFPLQMLYLLHPSDTLTFVESWVGNAVHPISDNLTLGDTITGVASDYLPDTVTFADLIKYNRTFSLSVHDLVVMTDQLRTTLSNAVSLSDGLGLLDQAQIAYIWHATATDSFSFSELIVREIFEIIIDDSLIFGDTLTHSKKGAADAADELVFADEFTLQLNSTRNPDDFVVFNDGFAVRVKGTPNAGDGIVPSLPLPGSPPYQPPSIPVGVSNIYAAVTMQGIANTIVLPPPEFNDYVQNQTKVIMQRSMTGMFRSYTKNTARIKLNWRFMIPKYKSDELRAFILAEIDNPLRVTDWEGNVWNVQIFSDTVEIAETGRWGGPIAAGDRNEVTLEFTGVKYA
jgi:hypothetical protein